MALRRNILIFHQAALGDFIVTWPLAVALGRMLPQNRLIYVTASSKGKLAEQVLGVESIDAESGWHALHADGAKLEEPCRKYLAGAHTIVSFVNNPGDAWERNVRQDAPEAMLVSVSTKAESEVEQSGHITSQIGRQLGEYPLIRAAFDQILRSVNDRGLSCRRNPDGAVVIHPGAGNPQKCWPIEKFIALAEQLQSRKRSVRMLLGETELEKWSTDAIKYVERVAEVRRPATYLDLLEEIASASLFIGNDSGPGHLAGIIGVPTLSLFGTDPTRWKPLGPKVRVVRGEGIERIEVGEVMDAIESRRD